MRSVSLAGKLQSTAVKPVIEITTDKQQYEVPFNQECAIQVKAVVKINGNTSLRHSQLYNITAEEIYYGTKLVVTENPEPNSWTVKYTPTQRMNNKISITVRGPTVYQHTSCYVEGY